MKKYLFFLLNVIIFVFIFLFVIWWWNHEVTYTKEEVLNSLELYKDDMSSITEIIDEKYTSIKWEDGDNLCCIRIYKNYDSAAKMESLINNPKLCFKHRNIVFFTETIPLYYKYFGITEVLR